MKALDDAREIAAVIQERSRARRLSLELSLSEVARRSGLRASQIMYIESGNNNNPTIVTISKLASGLGVSVGWLTGLDRKLPQMSPIALRIAIDVDNAIRSTGSGG